MDNPRPGGGAPRGTGCAALQEAGRDEAIDFAESVDVLIVDDEKVNLILLAGILKNQGVNLVTASSGQQALELAQHHDLALALLDVMMPGLDGFETAERLRSRPEAATLPIIFITAISKEQQFVFKGYELGAVDYLFKPVEPDVLRSKVQVFVDLHRKKRSLEQTTRQLEETVYRLKISERALRHQALHDPLTDLANRTLCLDRIGLAIERARRHKEYYYAVIFMDLDRFKALNDSYGHYFGDKLLRRIAGVLREQVRGFDTVSRYGSDEFVVLLEEISSPREAIRTVKRLRAALSQTVEIEGKEIRSTASMGIVVNSGSDLLPEEVLRNADIAMRWAKSQGRNRFKMFTPRMLEETVTALALENDMRRGIQRGEFYLLFQPILRLEDLAVHGFETLVRWNHPERGFVSPVEFIPMAEETGLILDLGRWILEQACVTHKQWSDEYPAAAQSSLSVNISGKQFSQTDLVPFVRHVLEETDMPPHLLRLEITETAIMEDAATAAVKLAQLKELGVATSIDDFGTGYSSMSYLQRFSLDSLKVDLSFVQRMETAPENVEIVRAIISLAQTLDLKVVAEGVETREQERILASLGCEYVQGFLYAKPLPPDLALQFLLAGC